MAARLKDRYQAEILPTLIEEFKYPSPMAAPRLRKIVVNMGLGEASQNVKVLDAAVRELGQVVGQKPVVTRARKSIANFKLRKNMPIGTMVTLRGDTMYEFLDRLISIGLPRVRDFLKPGSLEEKTFNLLEMNFNVGQSFYAPPGVPAARVAVLRKAFADMLADKAMQAELSKHNLDFGPQTPAQIDQEISRGFKGATPDVVKRFRVMMGGQKAKS